MVFSSIPAYLDPSNWQQQPNPPHHELAICTQASAQLLLPPPPPPPPAAHGAGGAGSIRPGSMVDRARMANIPMPEPALKCPRCESTNTKFCYFNNYSLSQPRHFCKTCRRYWTRGGALRSVPVGGGCRRNKRPKGGSSSKSPGSGDRQTVSGGSTGTVSPHSGSASDMLGHGHQFQPLRFMAPLHHPTHHEFTVPSDHLGLNYGSFLPTQPGGVSDHLSFQIGSSFSDAGFGSGSVISGNGSSGGSLLDQWRQLQQGQHQQLPFFGGLETSNSSPGIYPFEGGVHDPSPYGGGTSSGALVRPKLPSSGETQVTPVKMEYSQELNLSRQFAGINPAGTNDQFWTGSAWTDLTSFSSSSTSNHL